ncbi:MAG: DUF1127 domain-containing protein [Rhodospirillales bacterium]|nr:DUF1127 domain-containing protein [Rhodospirillales bacterium]
MSVPMNKSDFAFHLPQSFSYHSTWDDADYEPARKLGRFALLARAVVGTGSRLAAWSRRRAAIAELSGMNERELADIGITRSDIARVADPSFIDEHAGRGMVRG